MSGHTPYPGQPGQYPGQQPGGGFPQQPPRPKKNKKALPWILGCGCLALIVLVAAVGTGGYFLLSGSGGNGGNSASQPSAQPTPTKPEKPKYTGVPFQNACKALQSIGTKVVGPNPNPYPQKNKSVSSESRTCSWSKWDVDQDISVELSVDITVHNGNNNNDIKVTKHLVRNNTLNKKQHRIPNLGDEAYRYRVEEDAHVTARVSNLRIEVEYSKTEAGNDNLLVPYKQLNKTAIKATNMALQKVKQSS